MEMNEERLRYMPKRQRDIPTIESLNHNNSRYNQDDQQQFGAKAQKVNHQPPSEPLLPPAPPITANEDDYFNGNDYYFDGDDYYFDGDEDAHVADGSAIHANPSPPVDQDNRRSFEVATEYFTKFRKKYDSYNVQQDISTLLERILEADKHDSPNSFSGESITRCDGTKLGLATAVTAIHNVLVKESLTVKTRNNLLAVFSEVIGYKLPTYKYNEQQTQSATSLVYPVNTLLEFDVCENGCHVYAGEFKDQLMCPNTSCKKLRTGKCFQPMCKSVAASAHCCHGMQYRTARRVMQYRAISVYLQRALKHESFYRFATCKFENSRVPWDLMQMNVAQEQLDAMKATWNSRPESEKCGVKPLFLLLGVNYDGVKVYNRKSTSFNPLLISILNLPPALRNKKGVGMFPLSIFDATTGQDFTDCEDFLFSKCFVDELLLLMDGITIKTICEDGSQQSFFVQARLILHSYDTKAFEKIMKFVCASNAYEWCFLCNSVTGSGRAEVGPTVCVGNRGLLSIHSVLRYRGQSLHCCPPGFYGDHYGYHHFYETKELLQSAFRAEKRAGDLLKEHGVFSLNIANLKTKEVDCCYEGMQHQERVTALFEAKHGGPFSWLHSSYVDLDVYKKEIAHQLYYNHFDYRPQIDYKRTTNLQYFSRGLRASKSGRDAVDGVKGVYAFGKLPYGDIQKHVCWDAFHIFANLCVHMIERWKGERATGSKILKYCVKNKMHPSMYKFEEAPTDSEEEEAQQTSSSSIEEAEMKKKKKTKNVLIAKPGDWVIPVNVRHMIDCVVNNIILPSGCGEDFQIKSIFGATGNLHGVAKVKILVAIMDLINFCIYCMDPSYPISYLHFHKILSIDICNMMARGFTDRAVDELTQQVMETVALFEGIYPHSEALPANHQLVDIAAHIKTCGPLSTWWTLGGERGVGDTGGRAPTRGRKNYVTALQRDYQYCDAVLFHMFHKKLPKTTSAVLEDDHSGAFSDDDEGDDDELLIDKYNGDADEPNVYLHKELLSTIKVDDATGEITALSYNQAYCDPRNKIQAGVRFTEAEVVLMLNTLIAYFCMLLGDQNDMLLKEKSGWVEFPFTTAIHDMKEPVQGCLFFRLFVCLKVSKLHDNALYIEFRRICPHVIDTNDEFRLWLRHIHKIACRLFDMDNNCKYLVKANIDDPSKDPLIQQRLGKGRLYMEDVVFMMHHRQLFANLDFQCWMTSFDSAYYCGVTLSAMLKSSSRCKTKVQQLRPDSTNGISIVVEDQEMVDIPMSLQKVYNQDWLNSKSYIDSWCLYKETAKNKPNNTGEGVAKTKNACQVVVFVKFQLPCDSWGGDNVWALFEKRTRVSKINQPFFNDLCFVEKDKRGELQMLPLTAFLPTRLAIVPLSIIPKTFFDNNSKSKVKFQFGLKRFNPPDESSRKYFTDANRTTDIRNEHRHVDTLCLLPLQPYNKILK